MAGTGAPRAASPARPVPVPRSARPPMRRRLVSTASAVLAAVLLAGCVGSAKTPRADEVTPLPSGYRVVTDAEVPCRAGEAGFHYRFLVVTPDDLSSDGALLDHLRRRGFYRTVVDPTYDLAWATVGYNIDSIKVRLTAGPLSGYLDDPQAYTGPPVDQLDADARAHPDQYALIALRPYDFDCATPL